MSKKDDIGKCRRMIWELKAALGDLLVKRANGECELPAAVCNGICDMHRELSRLDSGLCNAAFNLSEEDRLDRLGQKSQDVMQRFERLLSQMPDDTTLGSVRAALDDDDDANWPNLFGHP